MIKKSGGGSEKYIRLMNSQKCINSTVKGFLYWFLTAEIIGFNKVKLSIKIIVTELKYNNKHHEHT